MKKTDISLASRRWSIVAVLAAIGLSLSLLWYRLGSLTYGRAADIEASGSAITWPDLLKHPLNDPYKLIQAVVNATGHDGITSLRLISTLFALLAAVLFYLVVRQWHSMRIALLASWLLISSSWFLHTGRLGSPEVLWLPAILGHFLILTPGRGGQNRNRYALPLRLAGLTAILYVPGMVWLVLAGCIVQRKRIFDSWAETRSSSLRLASLATVIVLIAPLAYGIIKLPNTLWDWLGFNTSSFSGHSVVTNAVSIPKSLFVQGQFDAVHWLAGLPLLSVFEMAACLIGLVFYFRNFRAARSRLIAVLAIVAWAVVVISGQTAISLILPVVYLLIASGMAYLLHLWFKTFPNNPVARGLGIGLIVLAVLLTSLYQTRSYFVAWRYNNETVQAFRNTL